MPADRNGFLELLQRYIDGTCSSEEKQMMDYWYDLLDQEPEKQTENAPRNHLEDKLWAAIQKRALPGKAPDERILLRWWQQQNE